MGRKLRDAILALALGSTALGLLLVVLAAPLPAIGQTAAAPQGLPEIQVNYAHYWINVRTVPLAAVAVVLADGPTIKASDSGQADLWGNYNYNLGKSGVQILPGDAVTVTAAGQVAAVNPVGAIDGALNLATESVAGAIHAEWFVPATLTVKCEVWPADKNSKGPEPVILPAVAANGGPYSCSFAGKWDLAPGDSVGVTYYEPDGDQVTNAFAVPAPELWINKWPVSGGEAAPGGAPVLFQIQYQNQGTGIAENVIITDVLPAGTTYVTDTSGAPPLLVAMPPAGAVEWHLGSLAPNVWRYFYVVLANNNSISNTLVNQALISTSSPGDKPDGNQAQGQIHVGDGAPDPNLKKSAKPGDVLPGDTFRYQIDVGNNASASGGPLWLTDTLPAGITLVSWYSNGGYDALWKLVSSDPAKPVFRLPVLPGNWNDQLVLIVQVNAGLPYDTQLTNTACLSMAGVSGERCTTDDKTFTKPPRYDMSVYKNWGSGSLVPGGIINYNLNYNNEGNATMHHIWLTDTLPAGTHFITSVVNTPFGQLPMPPDYQGAGKVAWDLGSMAPGEFGSLAVRLQIDEGLATGTVITNTADITSDRPEPGAKNNRSVVVETVRPAGPNLRISKYLSWNWEGQLRTDIYFENIGTSAIPGVVITDTLPMSTTFGGKWWSNSKEPLSVGYDPALRQVVGTLSLLEAGRSLDLGFDANLDGPYIGVQGLIYTNTARITTPPGDVWPADNQATATVFTGPDLYITKQVEAANLEPGGLVTYTIEFGNRNVWPWQVANPPGKGDPAELITDVLPSGMEFVTSTAYGKPWLPYYQVGNTLAWGLWQLNPQQSFSMQLVARILGSTPRASILTNTVQIKDIMPGDKEPFYGNNLAWATVRVNPYKNYLPVTVRQ